MLEILTANEVATLLKISKSQVYQLAKARDRDGKALPFVTIAFPLL
jgi:predicted DNA-binding transcriptional regulator AlpA